ncbi:MAG TPA: hypothetical protein VFZ25_15730 [Chloroflexota bacterium]|nr:hypothetical protein [Chloroflexota bacterium]
MFRLEDVQVRFGTVLSRVLPFLNRCVTAVAVTLMIAASLGGAAVEASPGALPVYGYDISFPQCKSGLPGVVSGQHVVGVNGGRPFTANPCFSAEIKWANAGNPRPALYMNLDYPRGAELGFSSNGPRGKCGANDQGCKMFNYGFNAASDAARRAGSFGQTVWWLDIETANYWSPNAALNAEIIRGALNYFQSHKLAVGIYSISPMWHKIAGGYAPGVPLWVASWRANVSALGHCTSENAFGGGTVTMVQGYRGNQDVNYLCPGKRWPSVAEQVMAPNSDDDEGKPEGTLASSRGGNTVSVTSGAVSPKEWVTYRLSFSPAGPDAANGLFVVAYQDGKEVLRTHATDTPTPGSLELKIQSHSASPIVYQLTSYNDPAAVPSISYSFDRE